MQIKTISKVISSKLEEWLSTISDEELKNDIKNNILVSGGSIASMFLSEPVNDYDVYIKDIDVLKRICEYYIKPFDITLLDGRIDKFEISRESNQYDIARENLKNDQLKLFFDENGGMRVNADKIEDDLNYDPVYFSPNAISLSNDLQIIIRFHGDNVQIHKTFDYIHATNYFTFNEGLVTNKEAVESLLTKQLRYQGSLYPLTSIIRMKKFLNRGWKISAGEILKILFQVSELNLKDTQVLHEQLIGVDIAYFDTLIKMLRGVDSNEVTSERLNTIIDKVFNT